MSKNPSAFPDRCTMVRVPGTFWDDHAERSPAGPGQSIAKPLARRGNQVILDLRDPGVAVLRADAAYYADADAMDECPRDVRQSARRTLAALERAGVAAAGEGA